MKNHNHYGIFIVVILLFIVGYMGCSTEESGNLGLFTDPVASETAVSEPVVSTWCGNEEEDPGQRFLPLDESFQLLPPLVIGLMTEREFEDLNPDLVNHITVSVCQVTSAENCDLVSELTSEGDGRHSAITYENDNYHVNWKVDKEQVGQLFEIHFQVGELELSAISLIPRTPRNMPIKFQIKNNALISAHVLQLQEYSAGEIAEELMRLYILTPLEMAWLLNTLDYGLVDIYGALINHVIGYPDSAQLEYIFDSLCFPEEQYLSLTALSVVSRFTPVLKFDKAYKGLPMSADVYFNVVMYPVINETEKTITWSALDAGPASGSYWDSKSEHWWPVELVCSRDECKNGMNNNDFATLNAGKVPTYFHVISDRDGLGAGRLRIAYWWFYGFQKACNDGAGAVGKDGSHYADWEHIIVTTSPDREAIEAVNYFFHGQWYTRHAGNYETDAGGERPVAYIGKTAHGSYHNRDHSGWMIGTPSYCCEYADYRNPNTASIWGNANDNLVSLSLDEESWMLADKIGSLYEHNGSQYEVLEWRWGPRIRFCYFYLFGCWDWGNNWAITTHPTGDKPTWSMASCKDEGCGGYDAACPYVPAADFNQGWPMNYSTIALFEGKDSFRLDSLSSLANSSVSCTSSANILHDRKSSLDAVVESVYKVWLVENFSFLH